MGLFSIKKYPDYWRQYEKQFSKKTPTQLDEANFVVFDTETTGLNTAKNKILSIGAIKINLKEMAVDQSLEVFVIQEQFNKKTVPIHGILKKGGPNKVSEEEALKLFLDFIGNSVLVAHHIAFDAAMINQLLKSFKLPKLKNKLIDTADIYRMQLGKGQLPVSLDTLCNELHVPAHDRHTALGDAVITAQIFQKLIAKIRKHQNLNLVDLYVRPKQHWV